MDILCQVQSSISVLIAHNVTVMPQLSQIMPSCPR